jgi:hypothetical protein
MAFIPRCSAAILLIAVAHPNDGLQIQKFWLARKPGAVSFFDFFSLSVDLACVPRLGFCNFGLR